MALSPQALQAYNDDGYFFHDQPILDAEEIAAILEEVDQITAGRSALPDYLIQLEDARSAADCAPTADNPVRKLSRLAYHLPAFEKLARDPRIIDLVESIIGPDVKLYSDEYFCKNPARGGKAFKPYKWHQDATNYSFLTPLDKVITCWIALDAATPENGCMQFIPRSHVFGSIAPQHRERFMKHPVLPEPVDAPREPGYAVLHHGLNFHGSGPNQSDRPRRAIAFHYMSADTLYIGIDDEQLRQSVQGGDMSDDFRFMLIRGREHALCV